MNILFLGTPLFSVPALSILTTIDFVDIKAVVTHPDKPKGRHLAVSPTLVKLTAQKCNMPLYQMECVSCEKSVRILEKMDLDLIIVVSFGEILSSEILKIPKAGCINLHASLLPKYRGAAPVAWAIMRGEKITGVTTFWLSEKMDTGDIILQKEVNIDPSDTKGTLEEKLSGAGAMLLKETVERINNGSAQRHKQIDTDATYAPKIKKTDGLIDWNRSASDIHNKIRAMNPWPVAYTFLNSKRIEIWDTEVVKGDTDEKSGTIVLLNNLGIGVAAGKDILFIKELQAEGRRRIKAVDFIHGYRINEGMVFRECN